MKKLLLLDADVVIDLHALDLFEKVNLYKVHDCIDNVLILRYIIQQI